MSRAFDEWKATDADIRAYMDLSHRWIDAAYGEIWDEAERDSLAHFDPDRDDVDGPVDVFDNKVSGLWDTDYFWMLLSGALRDAVTAFEVYAEKSISELLDRYQFQDQDSRLYRLTPVIGMNHLSPSWPTLRRVHAALGNGIETDPIKYVRSLRHLLTHQRGELRSQEQRDQFLAEANEKNWLAGEAYVGGGIPLEHARVNEMMDDIAAVVRACDPTVWRHTWGSAGFPEALQDLAKGKRAALSWVPIQSGELK